MKENISIGYFLGCLFDSFVSYISTSRGIYRDNKTSYGGKDSIKLSKDDFSPNEFEEFVKSAAPGMDLGQELLGRDAAFILCNVCENILREENIKDWSAALELKDIYACRLCVGKVAQIYAKGIMDACEDNCFGIMRPVSEMRGKEAALRVFNPEMRKIPPKNENAGIQEISLRELQGLSAAGDFVILDVRSKEEFSDKKFLEGTVNFPLEELAVNPMGVFAFGDRNTSFATICSTGYRSRLAAKILIDNNVKSVYCVQM